MVLPKLVNLFIIIQLLSNTVVFGQLTDAVKLKHQKNKSERPAKRNVIWFTPTRAKTINGLVLGSLPSSMFYHNDSLHINGIHIEINPIMLYIVPYVVIGSLTSPFLKTDSTRYFPNKFPDSSSYTTKSSISGLNVSILGSGEITNYKGISISSVVTIGRSIKGVSMTIGLNNFYEFHGLLIAGLMNNVSKGGGLQIGLFNRCNECKGVQLGLLNKMGKRTLPLINMRL